MLTSELGEQKRYLSKESFVKKGIATVMMEQLMCTTLAHQFQQKKTIQGNGDGFFVNNYSKPTALRLFFYSATPVKANATSPKSTLGKPGIV